MAIGGPRGHWIGTVVRFALSMDGKRADTRDAGHDAEP